MSKKEKLLKRFLSKPTDFTFDELVILLQHLGFRLNNAGNTSGSACIFKNSDNTRITLHKPHPSNILKIYNIRNITKKLKEANII